MVVVGAGIVGLATAVALLRQRPSLRLTVLEKEDRLAPHQTGHNSGVIHSGIYYRPGSRKADLCLRGRQLLLDFCRDRSIAHRICGKLILATRASEVARLRTLRERARANGIPGVVELGPREIRAREPEASGVLGLEVPTTGMVDYAEVCRALASEIASGGGEVRMGEGVLGLHTGADHVSLSTSRGTLEARYLVNCAGLHADRLARMAGLRPAMQIVPFRGEYYGVHPARTPDLHHHLYPVPDPALPFLGVHLTLTIHGRIEAGPNAVLAFRREGYRFAQVSGADLLEMASFPGFLPMARRFWKVGAYENFRSFCKLQFAEDLARLVPSLRPKDLVPGGAGVRAQAVSDSGALLDDFVIERGIRSTHVLNAPSPAATSSLAIAEEIVRHIPDPL